MKLSSRSLFAACLLSLSTSSMYALPFLAKRLKIINNYDKPIKVQIFATQGRVDSVEVPAKSEYTHKWRWTKWFNVTKFRVTYAPGAGFEKGTEKWIEIVIPEKHQGRALRPYVFTFNSPDDYSYKNTYFNL